MSEFSLESLAVVSELVKIAIFKITECNLNQSQLRKEICEITRCCDHPVSFVLTSALRRFSEFTTNGNYIRAFVLLVSEFINALLCRFEIENSGKDLIAQECFKKRVFAEIGVLESAYLPAVVSSCLRESSCVVMTIDQDGGDYQVKRNCWLAIRRLVRDYFSHCSFDIDTAALLFNLTYEYVFASGYNRKNLIECLAAASASFAGLTAIVPGERKSSSFLNYSGVFVNAGLRYPLRRRKTIFTINKLLSGCCEDVRCVFLSDGDERSGSVEFDKEFCLRLKLHKVELVVVDHELPSQELNLMLSDNIAVIQNVNKTDFDTMIYLVKIQPIRDYEMEISSFLHIRNLERVRLVQVGLFRYPIIHFGVECTTHRQLVICGDSEESCLRYKDAIAGCLRLLASVFVTNSVPFLLETRIGPRNLACVNEDWERSLSIKLQEFSRNGNAKGMTKLVAGALADAVVALADLEVSRGHQLDNFKWNQAEVADDNGSESSGSSSFKSCNDCLCLEPLSLKMELLAGVLRVCQHLLRLEIFCRRVPDCEVAFKDGGSVATAE